MLVKTVSKNTLSEENPMRASLLVMKESFLQEKMKTMAGKINSNNFFIGFKNNDNKQVYQRGFEPFVMIAQMQAWLYSL